MNRCTKKANASVIFTNMTREIILSCRFNAAALSCGPLELGNFASECELDTPIVYPNSVLQRVILEINDFAGVVSARCGRSTATLTLREITAALDMKRSAAKSFLLRRLILSQSSRDLAPHCYIALWSKVSLELYKRIRRRKRMDPRMRNHIVSHSGIHTDRLKFLSWVIASEF